MIRLISRKSILFIFICCIMMGFLGCSGSSGGSCKKECAWILAAGESKDNYYYKKCISDCEAEKESSAVILTDEGYDTESTDLEEESATESADPEEGSSEQ